MSLIIAEFLSVLEKSQTFIEAEATLKQTLSRLICDGFSQALEQLDDQLLQTKQESLMVLRKDRRQLDCLFGTITFKRRLYQTSTGQTQYLLDQTLDIPTRKRFSPYVTHLVGKLADHSVFRSVAEAVSLLTPVSMSHQRVGQLTQDLGQKVQAYQTVQAQRPVDPVDQRQVPLVYLEGDAFIVKEQRCQHRLTVHRFQICEGVEIQGRRHKLDHKYVITGLDKATVLKQVRAYLVQHYDLKQTLMITGSDNGVGYEPAIFEELTVGARGGRHFIDRYHVNRKIRTQLNFEPRLAQKLISLVSSKELVSTQTIWDTLDSMALTTEQRSQVARLKAYLTRNWAYLSTPNERTQYRGTGACESNHRRFTYRLKHEGRSWGQAGLAAMVAIITADENGELPAIIRWDYRQTMNKITDLGQQAVKQVRIKMASLMYDGPFRPHEGARQGRIVLNDAASSALGNLAKIFN